MITFIADMKLKRRLLFTLGLILVAALLHIFSMDATRVENQYSTGIYPSFGRFLRYLFGWLPFSLGDIIYGLVIIWVLYKVVGALKVLIKKQATWQGFVYSMLKIFNILFIIYILFNAFWGINYNRAGVANQLQLKIDKYSLQDLKMINNLLVKKTNGSKREVISRQIKYPSDEQLFNKVQHIYRQAKTIYPFLNYTPVSLKTSLWSRAGNYLGFTGYYNPLTGEAQVNTLVPKFLQPFTACHEVAHQLGYAKEMEANFVAYLAATASQDALVHYSVYLDLFMYSNRNLFISDSVAANEFRKQLVPAVQADLKEWRAFNNKHKNPVEPVFRWIYNIYLKQNQQPQGVLSYDEVTAFIIAWHKKYGKI